MIGSGGGDGGGFVMSRGRDRCCHIVYPLFSSSSSGKVDISFSCPTMPKVLLVDASRFSVILTASLRIQSFDEFSKVVR